MKKILFSLATIGVVGALAAGATSAWFSDTETSTGNTFTAGTLDLELSNNNGIVKGEVGKFEIKDIVPGWSKTLTYTVKNAGSIKGYLSLVSANVANTEGLNPESETGDIREPGELGGNIDAKVTVDGHVFTGHLNTITFGPIGSVELAAGETKTITVELSLPTSVGNDVQGDVVTGGFEAILEQVVSPV